MLTPLVRRLAIRVGAIHEARDRDVHVVPIPRLGGLAMYGGLAVGLFGASRIPELNGGIAGTGLIRGPLLAGGAPVAHPFRRHPGGPNAASPGAPPGDDS